MIMSWSTRILVLIDTDLWLVNLVIKHQWIYLVEKEHENLIIHNHIKNYVQCPYQNSSQRTIIFNEEMAVQVSFSKLLCYVNILCMLQMGAENVNGWSQNKTNFFTAALLLFLQYIYTFTAIIHLKKSNTKLDKN